ncbi:MAG: PilZ domain-containing protein [Thermoanaerobaculia bacterium]
MMNPKTAARSERSNWLERRLLPGPYATPLPAALESRQRLRRHSRYATRHLLIESPAFGWAVNISESGLCLESLTELVTGADYVFRLSYGSSFMTLPGRVAWSRLDRRETTREGGVEVYRTGIEFSREGSSRSWPETVERLTGVTLHA